MSETEKPKAAKADERDAAAVSLDRALDEALKETFPASDPPAMVQPRRTPEQGED